MTEPFTHAHYGSADCQMCDDFVLARCTESRGDDLMVDTNLLDELES